MQLEVFLLIVKTEYALIYIFTFGSKIEGIN